MTRYSNSLPLAHTDLTRIRRWFLILVAVVLWIASGMSARADDVAAGDADNDRPVIKVVESQPYVQHGITITPARSKTVTINGLTYDDVYDSIPYHHADASVNPGYRHDATMEILFGELRPTTIVRNTTIPTTQPAYTRPFYGYDRYGGLYGTNPWRFGNYYGLNYGLGYGLSTYRWSVWDNYLYRRSAFMFGVR